MKTWFRSTKVLVKTGFTV